MSSTKPSPVLLIPGLSGSRLQLIKDKEEQQIYPYPTIDPSSLDLHLAGYINPESFVYAGASKDEQIRPDDRDFGIYGIDTLLGTTSKAYYYHRLIETLKSLGYVVGKTLFGYPYDWRQSPDIPLIQDPLIKRIEMAYANSGGKKVTIIAHSLGCILMRTLMQLHPDVVKSRVRRVVTLGAPFNGASKIVKALVTGYNFDLMPFIAPMKTVHKVEV